MDDMHCIISVKCVGIIDLKARKNKLQVYNDLSNIYRKVFEVLKQFLYCVELSAFVLYCPIIISICARGPR